MAVTRRFADIDLSRLPALPAQPDFDAVFSARMADVADRLNAAGIPYDVGRKIAGDTVPILQRAAAYREVYVYAAFDAAIRAVLLATAWGVFLDHLGASQVPPVERLPLVTEPRAYAEAPEDWELDDDFRARIQLAPEALSTCGPEGGYLFFALSVAGVKAAAAYGPMSFGGTPDAPFAPLGQVRVPIVATAAASAATGGNGAAPAALVAAVQAALSDRTRRPLADFVVVEPAPILTYRIEAVLYVGPGADRGVVKAEAERRLAAQAARQHRPGAAQLRQMLFGAAYVPDASGAILVEEVDLIAPAADVNAAAIGPASPSAAYAAPYCTEIVVRVETPDE
ncbi:baseplate J/gp47 family protein [Methylobacterium oryzihabitans]|uniref:Baseplate J protein n=1 Tax=Methylobacterium oryzihabitans TaxID=2499852 RepID=A0A3S3U156_9HYPH|nr:baseplate J/gp47 family protein [Methylobacterium oryzihabitans]RVU13165.1 baseplate J protein [Methylobacterium oryzihabitans]